MKYDLTFNLAEAQEDLMCSVEKQLALTLYFLKDQGSLSMTANAFGIARCTVSVIVRKVCDVIARVFGTKIHKTLVNRAANERYCERHGR